MNSSTETVVEGKEPTIGEHVGQVARTAKLQTLSLVGELKGLSREAVRSKQLRVAECVGCFEAIALDAASILRRNRSHRLAGHVDRLASLTDDAVGYLARTDPEDVWVDMRVCVRRHPGAAFAALFLGGILFGRFLKSSSEGQFRAGSRS